MALERILVVAPEPVATTVVHALRDRVAAVGIVHSAAEAVERLAAEPCELVLVDLELPDGDMLVEQAVGLPAAPLVAVMAAESAVDSIVRTMRLGASDHLPKPVTPHGIQVFISKAEQHLELRRANRALLESSTPDGGLLVGRSPAMTRLRQVIARVAPTDATVLITGESGSGKEMVAREFFRLSTRRVKPFVTVNCAAVSASLMESEFFGHERGSFTGATERRQGRFELAHLGTLLLDEVSEIPPSLQAKLLRVLQERELERVGGSRTIKVNVRVLATSNRNLQEHVQNGQFRQDLFYRLNVFPVHVPALRERREDILPLAEHFLGRFVRKHGIKAVGFSVSARAAMAAYAWPGNVRELQNTVERAVIMTEPGRQISAFTLGLPLSPELVDREVVALSLPAASAAPTPAAPPAAAAPERRPVAPPARSHASAPPSSHRAKGGAETGITVVDPAGKLLTMDEIEKAAIRAAILRTGNKTRAAEALGISIRSLRNKLRDYRAAGDSSRVFCLGAMDV